MKRFKISIPLEYVMGHLRYGHLEYEVDADTFEEAMERIMDGSEDDYELIVDDWEVSDYGDVDYDDARIISVEETEETEKEV
jgi:hypothetical protein